MSKKKIKNSGIKYVDFAFIIDILYIFLKFQFIACLLLYFYYWDYANGKGSFQPILYLAPVGVVLIVRVLSNYIKNSLFAFLSGIVLGSLLIWQMPLEGNKIWISLAMVFALLTQSVQVKSEMSAESASYGARFRKVNRTTRWGVGIVVVIIFFSFALSDELKGLEIQPYQCRQYMLMAFGIYLVCNILMQYAFQYFNYYRRIGSVGEKSIHQMLRSIYFSTFALVLLIVFVFTVGFRLVEEFLKFIIPKILYVVFFIILTLADKLSELKFINFQSVVIKASSHGGIVARVNKEGRGNFPSWGYLLAAALVCGLVYVIWKIYKGKLTNYEIGDDRAEYIPISEDRNLILSDERRTLRRVYGNTNNERVRKHYYKSLRRRMQAYKGAHVNSRTPEELVVPLGRNEEEKQRLWTLTRHYEKARYSNEECTDAEVEESKAVQEYMQRGQIPNSPLTSEKSISIIEDK